MNVRPSVPEWIGVWEWESYYSYPPQDVLRALATHRDKFGCGHCFKRIGGGFSVNSVEMLGWIAINGIPRGVVPIGSSTPPGRLTYMLTNEERERLREVLGSHTSGTLHKCIEKVVSGRVYSSTTYGYVLNGSRAANPAAVIHICQALAVNPLDIFTEGSPISIAVKAAQQVTRDEMSGEIERLKGLLDGFKSARPGEDVDIVAEVERENANLRNEVDGLTGANDELRKCRDELLDDVNRLTARMKIVAEQRLSDRSAVEGELEKLKTQLTNEKSRSRVNQKHSNEVHEVQDRMHRAFKKKEKELEQQYTDKMNHAVKLNAEASARMADVERAWKEVKQERAQLYSIEEGLPVVHGCDCSTKPETMLEFYKTGFKDGFQEGARSVSTHTVT
jgi:hypothetical protein